MIELTSENFESNTSDGIVLVDFWAEWCGPCRMLSPIVENVSKTFEDDSDVKVFKVNVDDSQSIASKFNVTAIPTLAFIKDGAVIKTVSGVQPEAVITKALQDMKEL